MKNKGGGIASFTFSFCNSYRTPEMSQPLRAKGLQWGLAEAKWSFSLDSQSGEGDMQTDG